MNLSKHITAKCTLPISLPPIISHQLAENGWVPNQDEDVSFGTRNWSHDMLWPSTWKGHSEGKCRYLYNWLWEGDIDMIFISISKLRIVPHTSSKLRLCAPVSWFWASLRDLSWNQTSNQTYVIGRKARLMAHVMIPPPGAAIIDGFFSCFDIFLKVWSFENWECFIFLNIFFGGKNGVPGFAKRRIVWALLNG